MMRGFVCHESKQENLKCAKVRVWLGQLQTVSLNQRLLKRSNIQYYVILYFNSCDPRAVRCNIHYHVYLRDCLYNQDLLNQDFLDAQAYAFMLYYHVELYL
jgi:hypothetical protein